MSRKLHSKVTTEVDGAARGRRIGALFDLDRTLLHGFSATSFMRERLTSGSISAKEAMMTLVAAKNYLKGDKSFSKMVATTTKALKGVPEQTFIDLGQAIYEKHLSALIYPEARALVKAHQAKGHTLAIISSATPYQIEPVARELGIEHVFCTRFEVVDGLFTGEVIRPTCWGEGKSLAAKILAEEHHLALDQSFFYSDSCEDLPLLDLVGKPRPLNPDEKLENIAAERNWPIQHFGPPAKVGVKQALRNGLVFAGLVPSAALGLSVGMLTGSTRRGADTASRTWCDIACAAIGINVRVLGREHLWSQRPAVFIYNHQSTADSMIVPKVLEHDFVGVAKKEIANAPIYGHFVKAMGTVLIDRSDSKLARAGLEPAFEALRNGLSIVIAPEGTRSGSTTLGQFRKGAFHIAMQAGVPIVPFVVHNAIDVAPRGAKLFRPATVEVEVLPPISTDDWTAETLDERVHEIRNLFLERLGDSPEPAAAKPPAGKPAADTNKRPAKRRKARTPPA